MICKINGIVSGVAGFSPHSAGLMHAKSPARMLAPQPGSGALWKPDFKTRFQERS
jgi:hypothetical protein